MYMVDCTCWRMHRSKCVHAAEHVSAASSLSSVLCTLPPHRRAVVKNASFSCQLRCDCLSHVCAPSSAPKPPRICHPQSACICPNGAWACCTTLSSFIARHRILEKIARLKTAEVWPWPAHVSLPGAGRCHAQTVLAVSSKSMQSPTPPVLPSFFYSVVRTFVPPNPIPWISLACSDAQRGGVLG
jgi:hypothetical protein